MATISEKLVAHIGLNASAFSRGMKKVATDSGAMGTRAGRSFGSKFLKAAALPAIVGSIVAATVKMASSFEYGMHEVWTLMDINRDQFNAMSSDLLDLSAKMGMTTADMTKGLYDSVSAGIEAGDAIRFMGISTKAAIAGVTDTKVAVDALTSTLNAYGLGADHAARFSDIMFAAVIKGKTTFPEIADSVGKIGAIAAKAGVKFEDLMAAFATTTRQGMRAQTAMMTLRQALNAIIKPTAASADFAEEMGLDFSAAALKARGLYGVLKDVRIATKGNIEAMTKLFPNIRALSGVMGLAGKSAKDYDEILQFVAGSAGKTEGAFAKMEETTRRKARKLWAELKKVGITIGTDLLPSVHELIESVTTAIQKFGEWTESSKAIERTLLVISGLWGGFVAGLKFITAGVLYSIGKIIDAYNFIEEQLKKTKGRFEIVGSTIKKVLVSGSNAGKRAVLGVVDSVDGLASVFGMSTDKMQNSLSKSISKNVQTLGKLDKKIDESKAGIKELDGIFTGRWDIAELMAGPMFDEASEGGNAALNKILKAFGLMADEAKKTEEEITDSTEDESEERIEVYSKEADARRKAAFEAAINEKRIVKNATAEMENQWKIRAADYKESLEIQVKATMEAYGKIQRLQKETSQRAEDWEEKTFRIKIAGLTKEGKTLQTVAMARSFQARGLRAARSKDFEESRRLFDKAVEYYESALGTADRSNQGILMRSMEVAHSQAEAAHREFITQEKGKKKAAVERIREIQTLWENTRADFERGLKAVVKNKDAIDAVKAIKKELDALEDKTITITIKKIEGHSAGGLAGSLGVPSRLGTDTIPARLTPGEFVVNRQASRENLDLLRAINSGMSFRQSQKMVFPSRSGGDSPGQQADSGDIHIHINSNVTRETVRNIIIPEISAAKKRGWSSLREGR